MEIGFMIDKFRLKNPRSQNRDLGTQVEGKS
jgi:hypothetical protein